MAKRRKTREYTGDQNEQREGKATGGIEIESKKLPVGEKRETRDTGRKSDAGKERFAWRNVFCDRVPFRGLLEM